MAKWTALKNNWTPVAVADTANFTNEGYMALQGGSSTQRINVLEVQIAGLAAAASPVQMLLARDSTVGASSLSGVLNTANDPATAALAAPPNLFSTSTTKPQRSATLQLAALGFNAYGGIVRWVAPQDEDDGFAMLGNTASFGEISLSSAAAGTPGLVSAHIIYRPK